MYLADEEGGREKSMNVTELKVEMLRKNISPKDIAEWLDIHIDTARRKVRGEYDFTGSEMRLIAEKMELDNNRTAEIFF